MKYVILVNGQQKYLHPLTMRKAKLKADYLKQRGYALVEIVPENSVYPKKHKYNARRTEYAGETFDSQAEAKYYADLLLLQKANIVREIKLKPKYNLLKPYVHPKSGKVVRGIDYIADFFVTYTDGHEEVVDVKSVATRTAVYKLKKKMFEQQYRIPIREVER